MSELENLKDTMKRIQDGDAWHGPALSKTLSDVSAQEASARPVPGMHSIWELVIHIAAWQEVFLRRLHGHQMDEPDEGDFPAAPSADEAEWNKALERLERSHRKLLEYYAVLRNDSLNEKVIGKDYSIGFMLQGIVRHHVYHAGQIGLLKRWIRAE